MKRCTVQEEAQMEKVGIFKVFVCFVCFFFIQYQYRGEEARTDKREKRKGLSNSDLVMKHCGRKQLFLKEALYSLVKINQWVLSWIRHERKMKCNSVGRRDV